MYAHTYIDMVSEGGGGVSNKSQHDIYLNKMLLISPLCRLPRTTHPHWYKRYTYVYMYMYNVCMYVCYLGIFCFLYSGTIAQIMCSVDFVHKIDSND